MINYNGPLAGMETLPISGDSTLVITIPPTPGRVVWFYPSDSEFLHQKPLAAIVARVWSDRMVNLMVIDPTGVPYGRESVTLVQESDTIPAGPFATWMPYQVNAAQKAATAAQQA